MNLTKENLQSFTELQKIWLFKKAVSEAKRKLEEAKEAVIDQRDTCANSRFSGRQIEDIINDFFYKRDPEKDFFFSNTLADESSIRWTIYDAYEGVRGQKVLIFPKEYAEDLMKVIAEEFFLTYKEQKVKDYKKSCYYGEAIESHPNIEWVCYKIAPEILLDLDED